VNLDLDPKISAILEAQVAAGLFPSVAEAITAAVLGAAPADPGNLGWARPYLAAADADIEAGRTFNEEETFEEIDGMFGRS
jgi:Arc/MetJ-type ribon-helix-helix transcriptional regulator